jgi:hypothetical protein
MMKSLHEFYLGFVCFAGVSNSFKTKDSSRESCIILVAIANYFLQLIWYTCQSLSFKCSKEFTISAMNGQLSLIYLSSFVNDYEKICQLNH